MFGDAFENFNGFIIVSQSEFFGFELLFGQQQIWQVIETNVADHV
jgi:hypothetical protein